METFAGIIIGLGAFLIIGLLHPVVIKGEYYFGTKIWPLFLIGGLACLVFSLIVNNVLISSLLGILGFSLLWSILELFEQKSRVKKGWFPKNPNREY
jgi:hypothetical protein